MKRSVIIYALAGAALAAATPTRGVAGAARRSSRMAAMPGAWWNGCCESLS